MASGRSLVATKSTPPALLQPPPGPMVGTIFSTVSSSKKLNLRSWGSHVAANFLLDLSVSGGKFKLSPVANFSGLETVNALFTAGNIIEDTFEMNYFDAQDRF